MKRHSKIIVILAVIAITLAGFSPALAQEPQPEPPEKGSMKEMILEFFAQIFNLDLEEVRELVSDKIRLVKIAKDAGWSKEDIREKMPEVLQEALDQAVEDELITEEQAERMSNRHGRRVERRDDRLDALLERLGLSKEELKEKLDSGMTLKEIAKDQGIEITKKPNPRLRCCPPWVKGLALEKLAEQCGLSVEELREQLKDGKNLKEICPNVELPERPWKSPQQPLPEPGGGA